MDRGGDERHRTRRSSCAPHNDGRQGNRAARPRGASDAGRRRETSNFWALARGRARHLRGAGRRGLLLPGPRGRGAVLLLRGGLEVLGARGPPRRGAPAALPRLRVRAGSARGQRAPAGGLLRLRGRPAVEPAAEDDHGRAGHARAGRAPAAGGRGHAGHHLPQLARRGLGPARCSCTGGILLHRPRRQRQMLPLRRGAEELGAGGRPLAGARQVVSTERGQDYISNVQDSHFHLDDTVSGSQSSAGRDAGSRNDVVGGLAASSAMLSPVVQTVLQMGFEAALVESLVRTRFLLTGQHYTSVSNLVSDVLQAEQEDQRGSRSAEAETTEGSNAATVRTPTPIRQKATDPSPEELLRQLQEERTCKVCMDKLVSIVFIPCGHLVVCADCAASLRHCPICRAVIRGSVRAFMS
uniref:RING-type E3 ubiquitin transferase n=1 Tax=Gasterosteus aculeatus aculeatus TaxID=481459 RepID=G3NDL9_GASAC